MNAVGVARDLAPTGVLRAGINLGNPALAQGTANSPTGVTVDIAAHLGKQLGIPVKLVCFESARLSFKAITEDRVDICFLAIEPVRSAQIVFTAPYAVIDGVFAIPRDCGIVALEDVDQHRISVRVSEGSAYDLFLSRTLLRAQIVRSDEESTDRSKLEVLAGISQQMIEYVAHNPMFRLIEEPFMQILQAVGTSRGRTPESIAFLHTTVEELKVSGFISDALRRSGQDAVKAVKR